MEVYSICDILRCFLYLLNCYLKIGEEILKKYQGSVALALITLIPQHKWKPWLFITAPPNYWTDIKHQRAFMDWLKSQLGIKSMSGWYDVTRSAIAKNYGTCSYYKVDY